MIKEINKLSIVFIFITLLCFGQKMSFVYEVKYRLNDEMPDIFNTSKMVLDFSDSNSIFRENIDRKSDSLKMRNGIPMTNSGFENQFYIKKNFTDNIISKIITNGQFCYALPIEEILKWKILSENKKIGVYNCQKAVVEYGGRDWIAWFTDEIPINDGPYIFRDLPGLIVSIADSKSDYNFDLVQVKKSSNLFDSRTKVINIDWNKYEQLAKDYYQNPNAEIEQKIRNAKKVIMQDANGNVIDFDLRQMNKDRQEQIRNNNNPIELNRKIDYK